MLSRLADLYVESPHVDWKDGRPFAISRLSPKYANTLENLALEKRDAIKTLPVSPGWEPIAEKNPYNCEIFFLFGISYQSTHSSLFFALAKHICISCKRSANIHTEIHPVLVQCSSAVGNRLSRHKHPIRLSAPLLLMPKKVKRAMAKPERPLTRT